MTAPILTFTASVVLLAVAAQLAARSIRRPDVAHLLWLLVFARLLVPPLVSVPVLAPLALDASAESSVPVDSPDADRSGLLEGALIAGWALGVVVIAAATLRSTLHVKRMMRRAHAAPPALMDEVSGCAKELGLARPPRVCIVDAVISPALWPTRPPALLLPRALLAELSAQERRAILLHELAHLARGDHHVRALEVVVLAFYWWCPAVWWFRSELRFAEEACCDQVVLGLLRSEPEHYAQALIKTAAHIGARSPSRFPGIATGAGSLRPLERRIRSIMQTRITRPMPRAR